MSLNAPQIWKSGALSCDPISINLLGTFEQLRDSTSGGQEGLDGLCSPLDPELLGFCD